MIKCGGLRYEVAAYIYIHQNKPYNLMKHLLAMLMAGAALTLGLASCSNAKASADDEDVIVRDSTFTEVVHPDWTRNAVIYEVNWRKYSDSGKIAGVEKELPRLKDLGVDILWMMPIHPISELNRKGGLGSYYAVKDYKAVNPELDHRADEGFHR